MKRLDAKFNVSFHNVSVLLNTGSECWQCGVSNHLTKHHVIPVRMKPKRNLFIPLCKECHAMMHEHEQFIPIFKQISKKIKAFEEKHGKPDRTNSEDN